MARGKQSSGQCMYCEQIMSKGGMSKHLSTWVPGSGGCAKRMTLLAKTHSSHTGDERLHHLRVQADGQPMFWLDLEMRGAATLTDLDHYLRAIWLECCGHMSQFSFGGWGGEEIVMSRTINAVLQPDATLTHIYDFGTSSETLITSVGIRKGKPTSAHPIVLMARNMMPEARCIECGQPARWLCNECLIEYETTGTLCDIHVETHPHDGYGPPVELVNSPRMGMCGYTGPASPPY